MLTYSRLLHNVTRDLDNPKILIKFLSINGKWNSGAICDYMCRCRRLLERLDQSISPIIPWVSVGICKKVSACWGLHRKRENVIERMKEREVFLTPWQEIIKKYYDKSIKGRRNVKQGETRTDCSRWLQKVQANKGVARGGGGGKIWISRDWFVGCVLGVDQLRNKVKHLGPTCVTKITHPLSCCYVWYFLQGFDTSPCRKQYLT